MKRPRGIGIRLHRRTLSLYIVSRLVCRRPECKYARDEGALFFSPNFNELRTMSATNKAKGVKFTFSGHESFPCKSLWLKKGYDFVVAGNDFNSPEAVIGLGVGKNMVASIRFWLKAFGVTKENDKIEEIGDYLFDDLVEKISFWKILRLCGCFTSTLYSLRKLHFTKCSSVAFNVSVLTLIVNRC